jgi:(p)ppGpp synthase/HD superfamily hydrolase
MSILNKAIIFAVDKHAGMVRKGADVPYIVHPLEAVSIAAGITGDPEILAAAALHDVVEDTPTTMAEIESEFGRRIAELIAADNEDKMPGMPPSESWKARKEATIKVLQSASLDEKIIVLADKLSNIRAIHRDVNSMGDALWEKFNQKDKRMHEWYYRSIAECLSELSKHIAYQEYCRLIDIVFAK